MSKLIRIVLVTMVVLSVGLALAIGIRRSSRAKIAGAHTLVVHEWGTFTSIAGKNGIALEWRPLNGSIDLPKFVHTAQNQAPGLRHVQSKADLQALVRMETPVLYFYSDKEMNVSAEVQFPKGRITEWYPQARSAGAGINWGTVKITPGAAFNLPADYSENHYYAARETDAAAVQVCGTSGKPSEQEKFLFYRGVGNFDLPLSVRLDNSQLILRNSSKEAIPALIIFENQNGRVGYRMVDSLAAELVTERPVLDKNLEGVIQELRRTLISSGLYEKEADAMIKTWRNNWFEEGLRVFYILPRNTTDAVLPLTIDPRPSEVVRVLVGRTEIITPEMEKSVRDKVSLLSSSSAKIRAEAALAIKKYGRFSEPILKRIAEEEKDPAVRARVEQVIESAHSHSGQRSS